MAPTMTMAELRTAQRIREIDRPPTSVNLSTSVSGQKSRKDLQSLKADRCNYSFIHYQSLLILCKITGRLEPGPAVAGREAGCTVDRLTAHHRADI